MRKVLFGLLGITAGISVGLLVYRAIDAGKTDRLAKSVEEDDGYYWANRAEAHGLPSRLQ